MLKKEVTYIDYNGNQRTDTFYFNVNEAEAIRLNVQIPGGLEKYIENFDAEERPEDILNLFETTIKLAYGEKSEDGRYFIKSPEAVERFYQSAAYSALMIQLMQDTDAAVDFFNNIVQATTVPAKE